VDWEPFADGRCLESHNLLDETVNQRSSVTRTGRLVVLETIAPTRTGPKIACRNSREVEPNIRQTPGPYPKVVQSCYSLKFVPVAEEHLLNLQETFGCDFVTPSPREGSLQDGTVESCNGSGV
jgi:hypothetical protein